MPSDKSYTVTFENTIEVYEVIAATPEEARATAQGYLDDLQSKQHWLNIWVDNYEVIEEE